MPVIELENVSRLFGDFAALRKITAQMDAGQCYVLLGENGAGKTTLLRVISGLLRPTLGTVRVFGQENIQKIRGRIGYLSHASMLYDELTAMENLRYAATLYTDTAMVPPKTALSMVGLDATLHRPVGHYSQGMRQRVALARVLQAQPELLLMDEPFSNIDADSVRQMVQVLTTLRDQGHTILLTTHQPEHTRGLADVYCQMHQGAMVAWTASPRAPQSPIQTLGPSA